MNLLLLTPDDLIAENKALIKDRRLQHLHQIHQAQQGDTLKVGLLNQKMGTAHLERLTDTEAELSFQLDTLPPAKLPITLLLALPRPKMLKRILQTIATMGVTKLILVNSYKVEKSFWQTPFLTEQSIQQQLILGLEQARDTVLPEVILEKRFKPFVEDRLPALANNSLKLVAHLGDYPLCPSASEQAVTLAIGPEGGWIDYEVEKLKEVGFSPVQLGLRALRVETAVVALLTKIAY